MLFLLGAILSMEDLKPVIAKNIIDLRKSYNLTQAELAEKLNYSDKAVSKWERAESVPDVVVLKQIADIFNVTVDYLLKAEHTKKEDVSEAVKRQRNRNHLIITLLSTMLVFLIATIVFVVLGLYFGRIVQRQWMAYIYAVPVASIVLLVFNSIWGKRKLNYAIITVLLWSILLTIYLSFIDYNIWLIFILGIPGQIIIILWSRLKFKPKCK